MTTRHKIVYFGSSEHSADILEYVLGNAPFLEIVAVVTQPQREHAHTHQADTPVAKVALQHGLPLLRPHRASECVPELQSLDPVAGLLFAYGQILKPDLLAVFPKGIINIHPSLLPLHRGPSPIEATILAGDTEVGTTIMRISEAMDAGPILTQSRFMIDPAIKKVDLTQKLISESKKILLPALKRYLGDSLEPTAQNDEKATYCKLLRKENGQVDLATTSALQLERMIRAYSDWPGVTVDLPKKTNRLRIYTAHHTNLPTSKPGVYAHQGQLLLATNDGVLAAELVQLPGKKILTAKDALNGLHLSSYPKAD